MIQQKIKLWHILTITVYLKETALDNVMLNELTIKSFLEGFYLETSLMGNTLQGSTQNLSGFPQSDKNQRMLQAAGWNLFFFSKSVPTYTKPQPYTATATLYTHSASCLLFRKSGIQLSDTSSQDLVQLSLFFFV